MGVHGSRPDVKWGLQWHQSQSPSKERLATDKPFKRELIPGRGESGTRHLEEQRLHALRDLRATTAPPSWRGLGTSTVRAIFTTRALYYMVRCALGQALGGAAWVLLAARPSSSSDDALRQPRSHHARAARAARHDRGGSQRRRGAVFVL